MKNIDLSFITINYNSSILTIKLIESIISQTKDLCFEIIVVDNASEKACSTLIELGQADALRIYGKAIGQNSNYNILNEIFVAFNDFVIFVF